MLVDVLFSGGGFGESFGNPGGRWCALWCALWLALLVLRRKVSPIANRPTAAISSGHIFVVVVFGKLNDRFTFSIQSIR